MRFDLQPVVCTGYILNICTGMIYNIRFSTYELRPTYFRTTQDHHDYDGRYFQYYIIFNIIVILTR